MGDSLQSLVWDIEVRDDSKWKLLTALQRARLLEMLFLNANIEQLQEYHDQCVEKNAEVIVDEDTSKSDKEFIASCLDEWSAKVKERREHCWSVRGVSEFRDMARETRTRLRDNAAMVAALANELVAVEKQSGITSSEAGLKIFAAATAKLATGALNIHTPEGRQLMQEAGEQLIDIRNTELRDQEGKGRYKLKERELKIAERRVAALETKQAQAKDKLDKIVAKGGLTPDTLKHIEEAAKLL